MGHSTWSDDAYKSISTDYASKSVDEIFNASEAPEMSAVNVDIRESRDSDEHPTSLAVMVFLDVTGSMGMIPDAIAREKLGTLMSTIISNGVEHPQILFGAIGDHHSDRSPLQIGQFESGTEELDKWLSSIFIEGYGGGQDMESYLQAWLVAGRHTSIDCFEKRGEKGFLFTIGDERNWDSMDAASLKKILGYPQSETLTDVQLLEEAQRLYNVYHIHINETSYKDDPTVLGYWKKMLGERLIILDDYNAVTETIATIIAIQHGVDMTKVISGFGDSIGASVTNALAKITSSGMVAGGSNDGVMKL